MDNISLILVTLSAFAHALWNFYAKKNSGNLIGIWLGTLIASLIPLPYLLFSFFKNSLPAMEAFFWIFLSSIINAFYFIFLSKAYKKYDISLMYPLTRGTAILGTCFFSTLFFNEKISSIGSLGITLIILGILSLSFKGQEFKAKLKILAYPLLIGLTIVGFYLVDRKGINFVNPLIFLSIQYGLTSLLILPYLLSQNPIKKDFLLIVKKQIGFGLIIGIGTITSYSLVLFAFLRGPLAYLVAIRECAIVIGAILGILFLKEEITPLKIIGLILIPFGIILIKLA